MFKPPSNLLLPVSDDFRDASSPKLDRQDRCKTHEAEPKPVEPLHRHALAAADRLVAMGAPTKDWLEAEVKERLLASHRASG